MFSYDQSNYCFWLWQLWLWNLLLQSLISMVVQMYDMVWFVPDISAFNVKIHIQSQTFTHILVLNKYFVNMGILSRDNILPKQPNGP